MISYNYKLDTSFSDLCRLISCLLRANQDVGCVAYIACTQRNHGSLGLFLKTLIEQQLRYEVVMKRTFSPEECIMVHHEPLLPVFLYKIERAE